MKFAGLKKYVWIIEWLSVALLIALAIVTVVKKEILLFTLAFTFIIFGLLRVLPFLKTTKSKFVKYAFLFECICDVLIGGILVYYVVKYNNEAFNKAFIGYLIGGALYLRGVLYFLSIGIKNETTEIVPLLLNIGLITISSIILSKGTLTISSLAWTFFGTVLVCALVLAYKGYKDYKTYRLNLNKETNE